MVSKYIREQKRYTRKELVDIFECNENEITNYIRILKEYGILKTVKASKQQLEMSDLFEEDIVTFSSEDKDKGLYYVFTYVGIVIIAGRVLKCYPKYIVSQEEPKDCLIQILKVLEKYNTKKQIIQMFNESSEIGSFNILAAYIFFLEDYYENGLYSNAEDIIEQNGRGEILWEKTINETFAFFQDNTPFYVDVFTKNRLIDEQDFFSRLHACVISKSSKELKDADLLDLYGITEADISGENIEELGDLDYLLYRIEQEINVQFNSRKQLVLKSIYALLKQKGGLFETECISLYGTNSFNLVWEHACARILDNKLKTVLEDLSLPTKLNTEKYDVSMTLEDIIEKPLWTACNERASDTLIPDIISIWSNRFIIFDAKYYLAILNDGVKPKGQPGIESIVKQYVYQLAYQDFIDIHHFESVSNCFLLPHEGEEIIDKGKVLMDFFSMVNLDDISIRFLPANFVYDLYLSDKKMSIDLLNL